MALVLAPLAIGSLLVAAVSLSPQQSKPGITSPAEVPSVHISGRFNPELIPQQMLWESFLRDTATADTDTPELPRSKRINGLSKYTFKISVADVEKAVAIAVKTTRAVDQLREQLLQSNSLSDIERKRILSRSNDVVMQGRDEMARILSPASFDAIRTYVTEEHVKGVDVELPANPQ
jgi:hypothetical protein